MFQNNLVQYILYKTSPSIHSFFFEILLFPPKFSVGKNEKFDIVHVVRYLAKVTFTNRFGLQTVFGSLTSRTLNSDKSSVFISRRVHLNNESGRRLAHGEKGASKKTEKVVKKKFF